MSWISIYIIKIQLNITGSVIIIFPYMVGFQFIGFQLMQMTHVSGHRSRSGSMKSSCIFIREQRFVNHFGNYLAVSFPIQNSDIWS
jgi:hypothetical protein